MSIDEIRETALYQLNDYGRNWVIQKDRRTYKKKSWKEETMSKEKAGISELPDQKSGVPKIIIYKGSDTKCCTLGCKMLY